MNLPPQRDSHSHFKSQTPEVQAYMPWSSISNITCQWQVAVEAVRDTTDADDRAVVTWRLIAQYTEESSCIAHVGVLVWVTQIF